VLINCADALQERTAPDLGDFVTLGKEEVIDLVDDDLTPAELALVEDIERTYQRSKVGTRDYNIHTTPWGCAWHSNDNTSRVGNIKNTMPAAT